MSKRNGGYVLVDMRNIAVGVSTPHLYQGTVTYDAIAKAIENQKSICLYNLFIKMAPEDDAPSLPLSPLLIAFAIDTDSDLAQARYLEYIITVSADHRANHEYVVIRDTSGG